MPADKSYLYGLGDKLRILREAKHLKQSQVAKYLGISTTAVSEYESEIKTPSLEVFARLVAFYDISADYLIGISKDNLLKSLTLEQVDVIYRLIEHFKKENAR
ncbi:DNA-binding helix-turn-helix protein [[Clostridium] methylpentosum DSM 5476]|jgi:transcriptional regulator with XRE-family HTH domain|uniref:DNA-binding helix-turn-helix protein n=1 Tax=[Clostridium] methylpentosum DSM 5476 TaxID=537013 RepID=C0EAV3_9FIRM|nr:DNA-binding helix-turn-helix protein [[Clostridium] methylpentosum DSM 5476]MDY3989359.1 helix-turn-helix transcriptional regulator [Massilioclostridium sp.]MEE1492195.1 helix-turn-helix transcriptional regulator [Massilioclostridium sp.]